MALIGKPCSDRNDRKWIGSPHDAVNGKANPSMTQELAGCTADVNSERSREVGRTHAGLDRHLINRRKIEPAITQECDDTAEPFGFTTAGVAPNFSQEVRGQRGDDQIGITIGPEQLNKDTLCHN